MAHYETLTENGAEKRVRVRLDDDVVFLLGDQAQLEKTSLPRLVNDLLRDIGGREKAIDRTVGELVLRLKDKHGDEAAGSIADILETLLIRIRKGKLPPRDRLMLAIAGVLAEFSEGI